MLRISLFLLTSLFSTYLLSQGTSLSWIIETSYNQGNAKAMVTDNDGNIYVTGRFNGVSVDFDSGPDTLLVPGGPSQNLFFAKYDPNGNIVWAHSIYSMGQSEPAGIGFYADGIIIAGASGTNSDLDPDPLNSSPSVVGQYMFIARYDLDGHYEWSKILQGTGGAMPVDMSMDNSGNILLTGFFIGTVDFNPSSTVANLVSTSASDDIFIAKYSSTGDYSWAKKLGNGGYNSSTAITCDGSSNVYVVGDYTSTFDLDPGPGTTTLSLSPSNPDYVLKLSASGNFIWAKALYGTPGGTVQDVVSDDDGNISICGLFTGTMDADMSSATYPLTAVGNTDIFLVNCDSDGILTWANSFGSPGYDSGMGLFKDTFSNIYLTGDIDGTVDFDPAEETYNLDTADELGDAFVTAYTATGEFLWASSTSIGDMGWAVNVDAEGHCYFSGISDLNGFFVAKTGCEPSFTTIDAVACGAGYTAPDGEIYLTSGVYTAVLSSATGCDSIITINLSFDIDIPVTGTGNVLTGNIVADAYQWIHCPDGEPVAGAIGVTYTITTSGEYALIVEFGTCTYTSSCYYIDFLTLPGDFTGDGIVDTLDLNELMSVYGCATSTCSEWDLNGDGIVGSADIIEMIGLMNE